MSLLMRDFNILHSKQENYEMKVENTINMPSTDTLLNIYGLRRIRRLRVNIFAKVHNIYSRTISRTHLISTFVQAPRVLCGVLCLENTRASFYDF